MKSFSRWLSMGLFSLALGFGFGCADFQGESGPPGPHGPAGIPCPDKDGDGNPDPCITSAFIREDAVETRHIADASIGSAQLANEVLINSIRLGAGAVQNRHLGVAQIFGDSVFALNTITADKLFKPASLTNTALFGPNVIQSSIIMNGSIQGVDFADDSITSGKILNGTLTSADIAPNGITTDTIFGSSVFGDDRIFQFNTFDSDSVFAANVFDRDRVFANNVFKRQVIFNNDFFTDDRVFNDGVFQNPLLFGNDLLTGTQISEASLNGTLFNLANAIDSGDVVNGSLGSHDMLTDGITSERIFRNDLFTDDAVFADNVFDNQLLFGNTLFTDDRIFNPNIFDNPALFVNNLFTGVQIDEASLNGTLLNLANAIDSGDVVDATLRSRDMLTDGITSDRIFQNNAISRDAIFATGVFTDERIFAAGIFQNNLLFGIDVLTGREIDESTLDLGEISGSVGGSGITNGSITSADMMTDGITSERIFAAGVLNNDRIFAANTFDNQLLFGNTVFKDDRIFKNGVFDNGALFAANLFGGTWVNEASLDGTLLNLANAVDTGDVVDLTLRSRDMASDGITSDRPFLNGVLNNDRIFAANTFDNQLLFGNTVFKDDRIFKNGVFDNGALFAANLFGGTWVNEASLDGTLLNLADSIDAADVVNNSLRSQDMLSDGITSDRPFLNGVLSNDRIFAANTFDNELLFGATVFKDDRIFKNGVFDNGALFAANLFGGTWVNEATLDGTLLNLVNSIDAADVIDNSLRSQDMLSDGITSDRPFLNGVFANDRIFAANTFDNELLFGATVFKDDRIFKNGIFDSGALFAANLFGGTWVNEATLDGTLLNLVNSIDAADVINNSLRSQDMLSDGITSERIFSSTGFQFITPSLFGANVITTNAINALAVTSGKLAADAVTTDKIGTGQVTYDDILAGAVTGFIYFGDTVTTTWTLDGPSGASTSGADNIYDTGDFTTDTDSWFEVNFNASIRRNCATSSPAATNSSSVTVTIWEDVYDSTGLILTDTVERAYVVFPGNASATLVDGWYPTVSLHAMSRPADTIKRRFYVEIKSTNPSAAGGTKGCDVALDPLDGSRTFSVSVFKK